ncbi:MAG: hypothetical protein WAT79_17740, partial [Saprospiraceae bacterium]
LIPNHGLSYYPDLSEEIKKVELPTDQALAFLQKSLTELPNNHIGWNLITHQQLGLGWVKNIGSRINNYLPNEARIRMDIKLDQDEV